MKSSEVILHNMLHAEIMLTHPIIPELTLIVSDLEVKRSLSHDSSFQQLRSLHNPSGVIGWNSQGMACRNIDWWRRRQPKYTSTE